MKKETHPQYHTDAKVTCACGNTFTVGSTDEKIETEICSNCHPFYTGEEQLLDTAGRAEKFEKRRKSAEAKKGDESKKMKNAKKENKKGDDDKSKTEEMIEKANKKLNN